MEAFGEDRAEFAAGTDVRSLRAAALLRGRRLRSVPSEAAAAGSRSDSPVKDASDGGAAAGMAVGSSSAAAPFGTSGPVAAGTAPAEPASPALATPDLKASLALLD
ncbi:HNH endonuclease, partial [Arthrobacter sp. NPDC057013]